MLSPPSTPIDKVSGPRVVSVNSEMAEMTRKPRNAPAGEPPTAAILDDLAGQYQTNEPKEFVSRLGEGDEKNGFPDLEVAHFSVDSGD